MTTPIAVTFEGDDLLYDFPIIDLIVRDEQAAEYSIGFLPSDDISTNEKELISIRSASIEYSMVDTLFRRIESVLGDGKRIDRISHLGGADFAFIFVDGKTFEMAAHLSNASVIEASDRLKQIADIAESAFRLKLMAQRRGTTPPTTKAG